MSHEEYEYVGFWARVVATLLDSLLLVVLTLPLLYAVYGADDWTLGSPVKGSVDFVVSWVLPAMAIIAFWFVKQATPGKMLISAKIIDAATGGKPSVGQMIVRYLGYYVGMLPFFLGIIWVGIDSRKQGWHDKLAGTLVVRCKAAAVH